MQYPGVRSCVNGSGSKRYWRKSAGDLLPILAFVVSGFEHCVANMYYIPAGIFAAGNPAYVQKAQELYGWEQKN